MRTSRAGRGSNDSFDAALPGLYRAHARVIVEMAWVYVGDLADAEDVCVGAFARLGRAWKDIDPSAAAAYLHAAAFGIARSALRSTLLALRYRPGDEVYVPIDEQFAFGDDHAVLLAAVRSLPARRRNPILLRYWSDLSDAEIAAALRIPVAAVGVRLLRAGRALGIPDLDSRLGALAGLTHAQVHPSDDLLGRITAATSRPSRWAPPARRLAGAAAAAVTLALAGPLLAGDVNRPPMTKLEFIVQADQACAVITRADLTAPNAMGNKAVATAVLAATQRLLAAAYDADPPAGAMAVLGRVDRELQAALSTLQTLLADVDAGDLPRARVALDLFRDRTRAAASDLAAYGADTCLPRS